MLRFTLPSGRRLQMGSLHILYTYTADKIDDPRRQLAERIPGLVHQYFPGENIPFTIVWPPSPVLPTFLCLASFTSEAHGMNAPEGYSSLVTCWFVWHVDREVREIVGRGLGGLNWEEHARDVGWW